MTMNLIENARELWPKLWSVRLAALAAVLSACEVALPYFAPSTPSNLFAVLAVVVSIAAAGARLVAQPKAIEQAKVAAEAKEDAAAAK